MAVLLAPAAPCSADTVELPAPQADQLSGSELFQALGASRDQLPGYLAPGPLSNDEVVQVESTGGGRVIRVVDEQRIRMTGTGDYFVRESGPARSVTALGGDVPVLALGDLVWQGFSPGSRELAARIELDPEVESGHLPLRIGLTFAAGSGRPAVLGTDQVPGAGTVTLTVHNTTAQRASLPSASDAAAGPLAAALDRLLAGASRGGSGRLPTTRTGIPAQLQVTGATTRQVVQLVPLRLSGTLSVSTGAGQLGSVRLDGLLRGTSRFSVTVRQPGKLRLDLTAVPALDAALLAPPRGLPSWSAWAGSAPPAAERRAALDLLVAAAATGSRASAYSPYLGSELETRGRTTFRYQLAAARSSGPARTPLEPRPVPITLAILGAVALVGSGVVLWRRS